MDKPITTRLPEDFIESIKDISKRENIDSSTAIRKLLFEAIKEWKIKYALQKYSEGEFSFGEACDFAGLSVYEFPGFLKKYKTIINYDSEELEEDLKWARKK